MIPFKLPGLPYLLLAAFVAGAACTWRVMDWKQDAELARELKMAAVLRDDSFKIVLRTETVIQERVRTIEKRGKEIIKEVPVYVTKADDAACPIPAGFVRVHDAAAGEPAGTAAVAAPDTSGVTLSRVAETVADNYTEYQICREQVIGWNKFYDELRERFK